MDILSPILVPNFTAMKKELSQDAKVAILEQIAALLREKQDILFAYVFGSFMGEKGFSDIDIGIFVSNGSIGGLDLELKLEEEIQSLIHFPVDVRIINQAPSSFVYRLIKEGRLVKDNAPSRRADFEGLVFKKYLDFSFYRKQYLREVINAPV